MQHLGAWQCNKRIQMKSSQISAGDGMIIMSTSKFVCYVRGCNPHFYHRCFRSKLTGQNIGVVQLFHLPLPAWCTLYVYQMSKKSFATKETYQFSRTSRILQLMNPDADPCADFYEYSCGGYAKSKDIPFGHNSFRQMWKRSSIPC
ncbi:hypothetical protein CEXT_31351 [Caerostris extrusa]|uniref:Uncharacterized protein n=1 Tax=Caerostris extrusa TaxID=172846 RepID=A0AAV4RV24_CAEEX|nr:hypothetical protein CEXT_31351 [Caerostris extrusa]